VLAESAEKPEAYAVHYGLLRSLKQAVYTPEPEGHYALASDDYCHFTSPIRRYPDLQVHRQLTTLLAGKKPKSQHDELTVLAEHCNRTERRAESAERELIKIKLLTYLETRIGETFHAVIVGVEDFGLFCRLNELPAEGLLHVTTLADDFYYLEAETHTLIGRRAGRRYRLGDQVEVRIAHVDVDRRALDLHLTDTAPARESPARRSSPANEPRPPARSKPKASGKRKPSGGAPKKASGRKGKRRKS
jgi:ribonuclease R